MRDDRCLAVSTAMPERVGKGKFIHRTLDRSLLDGGVGGGAIVADNEQLERPKVRAANLGMST